MTAAPVPTNLIRAKQEAMERRQARQERARRRARREREALERRLSDAELREICYHEGGHCVVTTVSKGGKVTGLWADPSVRGDVVGSCDFLCGDVAPFDRAVMALAGSCAEYLGGFTARITYEGRDMAKALKEVAPSRIAAAQQQAIRVLVAHWHAVRRVADALVRHGELSGDDVRRLVGNIST